MNVTYTEMPEVRTTLPWSDVWDSHKSSEKRLRHAVRGYTSRLLWFHAWVMHGGNVVCFGPPGQKFLILTTSLVPSDPPTGDVSHSLCPRRFRGSTLTAVRLSSVTGPTVWNSVPDFIRRTRRSLKNWFGRLLKTYLFARHYSACPCSLLTLRHLNLFFQ